MREALKVQLYADGTLRDLAEDRNLDPDTVVSMNFWGFTPSIFPALRTYFEEFLQNEAGENLKAECLLPVMVDQQMKAGALEVSVLHSADKWFGMTYREDRELCVRNCCACMSRESILRPCGSEASKSAGAGKLLRGNWELIPPLAAQMAAGGGCIKTCDNLILFFHQFVSTFPDLNRL